jgi:UMF1 family MFS transporter
LVIQIEAIIGAVIFSRLSRKIGNKNVITIAIILWIVACIWAYFLNKENPTVEYQFYGVAAVVGLVMGGLQAMSRSTYSNFYRKTQWKTQRFSVFMMFWKKLPSLSEHLFCFIYRQIRFFKSHFCKIDVTLPSASGMRFAAFSMALFFFVGLILIRFLKLNTQKK